MKPFLRDIKAPLFEGALVTNLLHKSSAEGLGRTDTGSSPPVFEYQALCTNQFHHETYLMIGSLVVLAGMVRSIKGVGQMSYT